MSIYTITTNNRIFSTNVTKHKSDVYRTCVVSVTDRDVARSLKQCVYNNIEQCDIHIDEINYMDETFYKMLRLNNFALLIATDFVHNQYMSRLEFEGDYIDIEYDPSDDHREYFEKILSINA
jgi:hypothetical protein